MEESAKSIEAIDLRYIQDAYVAEDTNYRDQRYPAQPTEDEQYEFAEYAEMNTELCPGTCNQARIRTTLDDKTHHAHSQWL
eukprot:5181444-Amphidinium_carterae.1